MSAEIGTLGDDEVYVTFCVSEVTSCSAGFSRSLKCEGLGRVSNKSGIVLNSSTFIIGDTAVVVVLVVIVLVVVVLVVVVVLIVVDRVVDRVVMPIVSTEAVPLALRLLSARAISKSHKFA